MFHLLFVSSSSACFELENKNHYYAPQAYSVYLNNEKVRDGDTNVFSLFGLKSNSDYTVTVVSGETRESLIFRTQSERFAINVRDFGAVGVMIRKPSAPRWIFCRKADGCISRKENISHFRRRFVLI